MEDHILQLGDDITYDLGELYKVAEEGERKGVINRVSKKRIDEIIERIRETYNVLSENHETIGDEGKEIISNAFLGSMIDKTRFPIDENIDFRNYRNADLEYGVNLICAVANTAIKNNLDLKLNYFDPYTFNRFGGDLAYMVTTLGNPKKYRSPEEIDRINHTAQTIRIMGVIPSFDFQQLLSIQEAEAAQEGIIALVKGEEGVPEDKKESICNVVRMFYGHHLACLRNRQKLIGGVNNAREENNKAAETAKAAKENEQPKSGPVTVGPEQE